MPARQHVVHMSGEMDTWNPVFPNLVLWRKKLGLTQERAANLLGISQRHYQYYEAGVKEIPWTVVLACHLAYTQPHRVEEMTQERDMRAKFLKRKKK